MHNCLANYYAEDMYDRERSQMIAANPALADFAEVPSRNGYACVSRNRNLGPRTPSGAWLAESCDALGKRCSRNPEFRSGRSSMLDARFR